MVQQNKSYHTQSQVIVACFSGSSLSLTSHILLIKSFTSEVNWSPAWQKKKNHIIKHKELDKPIFPNDGPLTTI